MTYYLVQNINLRVVPKFQIFPDTTCKNHIFPIISNKLIAVPEDCIINQFKCRIISGVVN